jgi:mannose-1-phosphate guanylyltransferase
MSALYTNFKAQALGGGVHSFIDLPSDTIKVGIVDTSADYTFSAAHQDWDDVGLYAVNASYNSEANQTLGAKTTTDGVFDNAADITFTAVAIDGVKTVDALIHYKDSGVITTSPLICYHDGFTPITPNGGDIVVSYNTSGLFAL